MKVQAKRHRGAKTRFCVFAQVFAVFADSFRTGLADPPRTTRSLVAPASRACPRELTTPLARKPVRLGRKRDAAEAA